MNLTQLFSLFCQVFSPLEELGDFLLVLWHSAELVHELPLVDHESLGDMLDLQHLRDFWELVNVHVHEIHGVTEVGALFFEQWLEHVAGTAPGSAGL